MHSHLHRSYEVLQRLVYLFRFRCSRPAGETVLHRVALRYLINGGFQRLQIGFHHAPNPLRIDHIVAMTENIADACYIAPRDLRMTVSIVLRYVPHRFRYN